MDGTLSRIQKTECHALPVIGFAFGFSDLIVFAIEQLPGHERDSTYEHTTDGTKYL
jgi:hypothetical protein